MKTSCCRGIDVLVSPGARIGDDIGGEVVGVQPGQMYLTMHINDPQGLVAKEKGTGIAWATNMLVPEFIENEIYKKVSEELQKQFKEKGSSLTVEVGKIPPKGEKPTSDLKGGVFLGVLLSALCYGAVKLVRR